MSEHFLQSFFRRAKMQGAQIAVRILTRQGHFFIPNWQLRSKAKHFALGLLHLGFQRGERALLIPHHHPDYIFSDIGCLTAGLETLTPSAFQSHEFLQNLLELHHPTLLYAAGPMPSAWRRVLEGWRHFKAVVGAPASWTTGKHHYSFRKIFNMGIVQEGKQFQAYRQIQERRRPEDLMTPPDAYPDSPWSPLRFQSVDLAETVLAPSLPHPKVRRVVTELDLGQVEARLLGLYWPLATAREAIWVPPGMPPEAALRQFQPRVAGLAPATLERLAAEVALSPKIHGLLSRWKQGPWQKRMGKRLQLLWLLGREAKPPPPSPKIPFRIAAFPTPPQNFPLVKKQPLG